MHAYVHTFMHTFGRVSVLVGGGWVFGCFGVGGCLVGRSVGGLVGWAWCG